MYVIVSYYYRRISISRNTPLRLRSMLQTMPAFFGRSYNCILVCLPPIARGVVEGVGCVRAVYAILSDLAIGVVFVPQLLEGNQILLGNITGTCVVKVYGVRGGVRVHPAVVGEGGEPVVIVGGVDSSAALVVAGAGSGGQANATAA